MQKDEIEEDIPLDAEDRQAKVDAALLSSSGALSASAVGIDHSIDTMNLNEFDYVEEVKNKTPRSGKEEKELELEDFDSNKKE